MTETIVKLKNAEIFYRSTGNGPVVVLIHGFGEDSTVWEDQYEAFPGYRLLMPDLPGSGLSPLAKDMSMEGMAMAIKLLLDELKISTCIMIGHSMGGYVTLAFVEKFADRLQAFGLFHSTSFADNEEKKDTRRKGIEFIRENGPFAFLKTTIPNLFSPENRENKPALVQEQVEASRDFTAEALIAYYKAMINRPDRTELLRQTPLPVLFIIGKFDQAVPMQDSLKQSYLPTVSHVHLFEQSGHMGMKEEKTRTNEAIMKFLEETGV